MKKVIFASICSLAAAMAFAQPPMNQNMPTDTSYTMSDSVGTRSSDSLSYSSSQPSMQNQPMASDTTNNYNQKQQLKKQKGV